MERGMNARGGLDEARRKLTDALCCAALDLRAGFTAAGRYRRILRGRAERKEAKKP